MSELFLNLNGRFSEDDKERCTPMVYKIIDMANIARRVGILGLEVEMAYEQNFLLKQAVELIVDGTDPDNGASRL